MSYSISQTLYTVKQETMNKSKENSRRRELDRPVRTSNIRITQPEYKISACFSFQNETFENVVKNKKIGRSTNQTSRNKKIVTNKNVLIQVEQQIRYS